MFKQLTLTLVTVQSSGEGGREREREKEEERERDLLLERVRDSEIKMLSLLQDGVCMCSQVHTYAHQRKHMHAGLHFMFLGAPLHATLC